MSQKMNRRDILKGAAAATAGYWVLGRQTMAQELSSKSPNEKVNFASIGIGGKGDSDSEHVGKLGNLVAICDVDTDRLGKKNEKYPKAKAFTDFREMFDKMGKEFDAVTVSTPDHTHAVATMMAIKAGKHVYTQKPMTHDVSEARALRLAAKEAKVATQMGNQGTASSKLREGVELIQAGVLGDVTEVHIWTNRPVWPQSPTITTRPEVAPVPANLKWDLWLGTAPFREYGAKFYHPFNWRGWWDYGTGALGDMGCHTANLPFMALKLGYPKTLVGSSEELNKETYPAWGRADYEFDARGSMPPVKVSWYEGKKDGKLVHPPEELVKKVLEQAGVKGKGGAAPQLNNSGSIIVGSKGMLYSPHDYGGAWVLLPQEQFKDYKAPAQTLPRNDKGDEGQKAEWVAAIKGGPAALSNFDYAGMLTEFILLGNIAILGKGKKLEWDGPNMKFTNAPEMDQYLKRTYRAPWTL
ncbi:Gfo/Idh/MocA family oxidoreductase [Humisphaera borealis]|uniref:Gfo/Idh/MocA family oxidoreductase n=1 Tax=Humisphaera borealis TaxID=2807512 RepID=A0A7M2X1B5_9BACT|nr:Gfo/Idh/MocA family oxidoreductase [Humisphaera borealis]QOV91475.1 Gfo/Idh/MocA family oxidoreductase [Humisphaera borealis]